LDWRIRTGVGRPAAPFPALRLAISPANLRSRGGLRHPHPQPRQIRRAVGAAHGLEHLRGTALLAGAQQRDAEVQVGVVRALGPTLGDALVVLAQPG